MTCHMKPINQNIKCSEMLSYSRKLQAMYTFVLTQPLCRVLALFEMHTASLRIWTCIAVSNSYDNNCYIMIGQQI